MEKDDALAIIANPEHQMGCIRIWDCWQVVSQQDITWHF